jgi:hypothetical protein
MHACWLPYPLTDAPPAKKSKKTKQGAGAAGDNGAEEQELNLSHSNGRVHTADGDITVTQIPADVALALTGKCHLRHARRMHLTSL